MSSASTGWTSWLWPVLRPYRPTMALGSTAVLTQIAANLTAPYLLKVAIDGGVAGGDLVLLDTLALVYLAVVAVQIVASRIEIRTVAAVGQQALHTVRELLFARLQRLPFSFYQQERNGGLVSRMTNDVGALTGLVAGGLVQLVTAAVNVVGVVVVLAVLDLRLALATSVVVPVLALGARWFQRRSGRAYRQVQQAGAAVVVAFQETISGIREVQALRRETIVLDGIIGADAESRRAGRAALLAGAVFFPAVEFVSAAAVVLVLAVGGTRVAAGDLSIGTLSAFLAYLGLLFSPVYTLSELYNTALAAAAGAERIGTVLDTPAVTDPDRPLPLPDAAGELRLRGVNFAYPGPDASVGPDVLHDVDMVVPAGHTVALVGASGAGKSTIAGLILRFNEPSTGSVTLDGLDLRRLSTVDLRRSVALVPQDGFLFSGTVEENIRYGSPGADRSRIESAVTALGVGATIHRMREGLATEVGERGEGLSSGERQIVALLRACVSEPAVLVLDEATSHLDPDTEGEIESALRRLRRHRTTVIIAHRLSSVLSADLIVLLEGGHVAESGPPAQLLAAGGRFTALHRTWLATAGRQPSGAPA